MCSCAIRKLSIMSIATLRKPDENVVVTKALLNAAKELGLTQADVGAVVGKDRTAISRNGIDPDSKAGELALLLIRAYRALFVLVGGDSGQMRHWMHTDNLHTGGIPAEQIRTVQGLLRVVGYLDAIRGRL
jgi:antitoxin Xre/MbcA/ParS-like protein